MVFSMQMLHTSNEMLSGSGDSNFGNKTIILRDINTHIHIHIVIKSISINIFNVWKHNVYKFLDESSNSIFCMLHDTDAADAIH